MTEVLSQSNEGGEVIDLSASRAARKQHDKIVAWATDQYKMIRNARSRTELQWYVNLAFYFGKQYVQPIRVGEGPNSGVRLWTPPAVYYRARPVINRIRPTIRTELAQLTNNKPNATVVPASAEDRDMYAAMAGEQIWNTFYTEKKLKAVIRRAMWWTLNCGTAFIKSYWDDSKGPVDETTGQVSGDICFTHETPFHILCPDMREEDLEAQPFLIHVQTRTPEFVSMRYKKALDGTELKPAASNNEVLEESFLHMSGTQSLKQNNSVLIMEFWIKPGQVPMFPKGALLTIIGDKLVQFFEGWPYSHGKFPFAKFDHIPSGKFYASSLIEDLIPLQKEYNRTRGQIIENKNRMAKLQLIYPRGSIDPSKITSEPGLAIPYNPGLGKPEPMPLQALPSYVLQELDRALVDWNDIAGQHEVSKGQVPPGVTAATAISFLQERDESKLTHTFDSLEEGIEKIAQMSLSYVKDFWSEERTLKVVGPDGSFDALAFKGSDLNDNTDIRVEAGSAMPTSKAAKQALVLDLMKLGLIEPQEGLEVMDMGGIHKIFERVQVDQRQAQRENLRMSKVTEEDLQEYNDQNMQQLMQDPMAFDGMEPPLAVPVNTWDNHELHIQYHNQFRKGQAFEGLPEIVKTLFESHVQSHIMALGMETLTQDPRAAAGLPPEMPGEETEEETDPMSQMEGPQAEPQTELPMEGM